MASSATAKSGSNIVPRRLQGPIAAATEELHQQHQQPQQTHELGPGAGVGGQAREQHEHEHEQQQEHVGLGPGVGVDGQTQQQQQQQQQQQHMGFGPVGVVGGQSHGITTVEESSISNTTYYNLSPFAIAVIVIVPLVFVPFAIVFFQRIVVRRRKSRAAAKHLMNDLNLTMTSHEKYHGRTTTYSSHSLSSIGSSFSSAGSSCDGFESSIAAIFQSNANTTKRTTSALDSSLKTIIPGGGRRVSFLSTNSEEEQKNLKTGLSDVV